MKQNRGQNQGDQDAAPDRSAAPGDGDNRGGRIGRPGGAGGEGTETWNDEGGASIDEAREQNSPRANDDGEETGEQDSQDSPTRHGQGDRYAQSIGQPGQRGATPEGNETKRSRRIG